MPPQPIGQIPQIPIDVGRIVADVRNSVETALRTLPSINILPIPSVNMNWGNPIGCPNQASSASSSGRPPIPAFPKDDEILVQVGTHAIKNTYNLKKSVTISTISGSIKAEIVPSPTPTTELFRKLHTQTNTGSQHITVATSLGPFMMDSSHSTMTGSIKAIYPDDWCGTIELSVTHGSYKLGDAIVVRDVVDQSTRERQVLALRGNPQEGEEFSTMKITSKTGSVDVRFEKMPQLRDLTSQEIRAEEEAEEAAKRRDTATGLQGGLNKEQKEKMGAAVVRQATTSTVTGSTTPYSHSQAEQPQHVADADLPPSYEQSEEENVRMQVAGRD